MKKLFYAGLLAFALFEFLKVYFIMPMPGSQESETLDIAYLLHTNRWLIRLLLAALAAAGILHAFKGRHKWLPALAILAAGAVAYVFNFEMTAESMFKEPQKLSMKPRPENILNDSSMVLGVEHNGEAKAYPIRFLAYHHQVQDTVGGKPVIVTYCNVCRTGRTYEPMVNGKHETFRLVGMDHFNAMFEDATTKSWWRQVTGEAVAGKLKGSQLPEVETSQMTLGKWFDLYPAALVMQPDEASLMEYDSLARFERGLSKGELTRSDSLSWKDKSWVIGIQIGKDSKAYDWNRLKKERIINDSVGQKHIVLALATDDMSFAAFERPSNTYLAIRNDTLYADSIGYNFAGSSLTPSAPALSKLPAYQEFWHSWRTFHPNTTRY